MTEGKPHPVLAGFADVYSAAIILGAPVAVYVALAKRTVPLYLPFVSLVALVILVILYYRLVARRVKWLSPGEAMLGRKVRDDSKKWMNPYGRNRAPLFALMIFSLMIAGNAWDSATSETVVGLDKVLAKGIFVFLLLAGLILVGQGKALGGLLVAPYFALMGLGLLGLRLPDDAPTTAFRGMALFMFGVALASVVLSLVYAEFARKAVCLSRVASISPTTDAAETSLVNPDVSVDVLRPWSIPRTAGYSLLIVLAFAATQIAVAIIMLVTRLVNAPEFNIEQWVEGLESNGLFLSLATFSTTLLCVPFVKYLVGRRDTDPWTFLYLRHTSLRRVLHWSVALIAFVAVSDAISVATGRPVVPEFMNAVFSSGNPALLFIALVFCAPFFEEIFFRGFLIGALESSGVSKIVSAVVSSVAWSAIHVQYGWYELGWIFLAGMLLAAARTQTRSLVPCLVMHGIANVIAFTEAAFASGAR